MRDENFDDLKLREAQKMIASSEVSELDDQIEGRGKRTHIRVHNRYFSKRMKSKKNDEPGSLFDRRR